MGAGCWGLGTGDWGLGTGDWGLGTGEIRQQSIQKSKIKNFCLVPPAFSFAIPNPQSPIPNPQYPVPKFVLS
ncbi:hypothetical protein CK516_35520 [Nostoc sp. 'Peltigera malacea cyanobiont' DB3992]|nr:hypothetical protein CK516_35520 [Nostoc sp. 'Peltigera malacea cyanobiont' DB3992]